MLHYADGASFNVTSTRLFISRWPVRWTCIYLVGKAIHKFISCIFTHDEMINLNVYSSLSLNLQKFWYKFLLILLFRLRHFDSFSDLGLPNSPFPNFFLLCCHHVYRFLSLNLQKFWYKFLLILLFRLGTSAHFRTLAFPIPYFEIFSVCAAAFKVLIWSKSMVSIQTNFFNFPFGFPTDLPPKHPLTLPSSIHAMWPDFFTLF